MTPITLGWDTLGYVLQRSLTDHWLIFISFNRLVNCEDHLKRHEGKHLKCDHPGCERLFYRQDKLDIHKNFAHEHKYPCDWPGCEFFAKNHYNLKHHKYIHTGERPYKCTWPECDKRLGFALTTDCLISVWFSFRTEPAFSTHMRLHKNDKCYACAWPGCDYRGHDRGTMRYHRLKHERDASRGQVPNAGPQSEPKSQKNGSQKQRIETKVSRVDRSGMKRRAKKPRRYETDSDSSESLWNLIIIIIWN